MPINKSERVFKDLLVQSPSWVAKYGACWHEFPPDEDYFEDKIFRCNHCNVQDKQWEYMGAETTYTHNPDLTDGQHLEAMWEAVLEVKGWRHDFRCWWNYHRSTSLGEIRRVHGKWLIPTHLLKASNLLDALYEFNEGR